MIDVEAMRANLHGTFNGGWHHSEDGMKAFHHGMDTVCNVLAAWLKNEQTNGILPERAASAGVPAPQHCPHCHLPAEPPTPCTPEVNAVLEAQTAKDAALFEAGRQHGIQHYPFGVPAPQSQPDEYVEGTRRWLSGERINVSTGIAADELTYGYGALDFNGYWEFPLHPRICDLLDDKAAAVGVPAPQNTAVNKLKALRLTIESLEPGSTRLWRSDVLSGIDLFLQVAENEARQEVK